MFPKILQNLEKKFFEKTSSKNFQKKFQKKKILESMQKTFSKIRKQKQKQKAQKNPYDWVSKEVEGTKK